MQVSRFWACSKNYSGESGRFKGTAESASRMTKNTCCIRLGTSSMNRTSGVDPRAAHHAAETPETTPRTPGMNLRAPSR